MKGKKPVKTNAAHILQQRLTEIEGKMDLIKEDLEEIKLNTAKKRRKRLSLFSKKKKDRRKAEDQTGSKEMDLPDMGALLNNPMLKSLLQNKKGAMDILQGMDPNHIANVLKNPMIQSMLKNLM